MCSKCVRTVAGLTWSARAIAGRLCPSAASSKTSSSRGAKRDRNRALPRALRVWIDYLADGTPPPPMLEHRALLYETDEEFLDVAVPFLREAVELDEGAIAVTTPGKIEMLRDTLGSDARRVQFAPHS